MLDDPAPFQKNHDEVLAMIQTLENDPKHQRVYLGTTAMQRYCFNYIAIDSMGTRRLGSEKLNSHEMAEIAHDIRTNND